MENQHLAGFEKALQAWDDQRFITRDDLRALAMFNMYLVNLLEAQGYSYDGHSLNIKTPMCLLVVRGTSDGVPQIVFTSARTPIGCIRIFVRKVEGEMLEWRPDKFRS